MKVIEINTKKRSVICGICLEGTGIVYEFQGKSEIKLCRGCLLEVKSYVPLRT